MNGLPIAEIWFEHDLEDGWYRMKEPNGISDTWGIASNALKFCKEQGWKLIWTGSDNYNPFNKGELD